MESGFADFSQIPGIDGWDQSEFEEKRKKRREKAKQAAAIKTRSRHRQSRVSSKELLSRTLPPIIEPGDSWHIISQGNVDSLSYLAHILTAGPVEYVLLSTWCMAGADVDALSDWLQAGTIHRLDCYVGEIFPSQYAAIHDQLCQVVREHGNGGRVAVFRNHSKVMVTAAPTRGAYHVIESSANINTNPRAEQTTITADESTAEFYKRFFDAIKSYNKNYPDWEPYPWAAPPPQQD